jgi:hypothetical protein
VVLRGAPARLHRALTQLMLDAQQQSTGYATYVPYLVNDASLFGTGSYRSWRRICSPWREPRAGCPRFRRPRCRSRTVRDSIVEAGALPMS